MSNCLGEKLKRKCSFLRFFLQLSWFLEGVRFIFALKPPSSAPVDGSSHSWRGCWMDPPICVRERHRKSSDLDSPSAQNFYAFVSKEAFCLQSKRLHFAAKLVKFRSYKCVNRGGVQPSERWWWRLWRPVIERWRRADDSSRWCRSYNQSVWVRSASVVLLFVPVFLTDQQQHGVPPPSRLWLGLLARQPLAWL